MKVRLLIPNGVSLDPQKPKMLKQLEIKLLSIDVLTTDMLFITNESEEILMPTSSKMKLQLKASEQGWYKKAQVIRANRGTIIYFQPINIQSLASVPREDGTIDYYDAKAHYDRHYGDPTQLKMIN